MITPAGVKVLDFGLAKIIEPLPAPTESTQPMTASHAVTGGSRHATSNWSWRGPPRQTSPPSRSGRATQQRKLRISPRAERCRRRHDGTELFYVAPGGTIMGADIRAGQSLDAGAPRVLFRACAATQTLRGTEDFYDVGVDGKRFLLSWQAAETKQRSITVITQWTWLMK